MAPKYVKTIDDVVNYYYAWLVISKAAGKMDEFGFVTYQFKKLKQGQIKMADRNGEIRVQMKSAPVCVYCGDEADGWDHVIPRNKDGPDVMYNEVRACKSCNSSKGDKDLVDWWVNTLGREERTLPRIPIGIYLKYAHDWHKMRDSLSTLANDLTELKPFVKGRAKYSK